MQSKSIHYIPALDHLRFLAAGMVVLFHTNMATQNSGRPADLFPIPLIDDRHTGVARFMVISGFIMMMMFTRRELQPLKFYMNRFLRIYPLLILVVSAGYFSTPDPRSTSVGVDYLMSLLPISNLYRLNYGAFGGHLWTIAVELQFYLLLPILLKFRHSYGARAFYGCILGLAFALRLAQYKMNGTAHTFTYFTIFGSIDMFVGGMIAAELYQIMQERKLRFSLWWSAIVMVAIGATVAWIFSYPSFFQIDFHHVTSDAVSRSNKWLFWPLLQAFMWGSFLLLYLRSAWRNFGFDDPRPLWRMELLHVYLAHSYYRNSEGQIPLDDALHIRRICHSAGYACHFVRELQTDRRLGHRAARSPLDRALVVSDCGRLGPSRSTFAA